MTDDADAAMSGMEGHVRDKKYLPVLMPKNDRERVESVRPWKMD